MHRILTPLSRFPTWTKGTSKLSTAPARAPSLSNREQRRRERDKTNQNLWNAVVSWNCQPWVDTEGLRNNPLLHRQSVSTEDWNRKNSFDFTDLSVFLSKYTFGLNCFLYFYRWVPRIHRSSAPMAGKVLCHTNACSTMFSINTRK